MNDWVFIHPWAHFAAHFWILGNVTRFRLLFCCRECYAIAFVFGMTFTSLPRLTRPCWDAEFWLEPFSVQMLMMGTCQCLAQTEFPIFAFFFFFQSGNHWANQGFSHSDFILLYCMVSRSLPLWIGLPWAWWKACLCIRSFHSSTVLRTPPVQNALHSPLILLEPQGTRQVLGRQWFGALSGKRGLVLWEIIETTFLWMSELKAESFFNSYWYHLLLGWIR